MAMRYPRPPAGAAQPVDEVAHLLDTNEGGIALARIPEPAPQYEQVGMRTGNDLLIDSVAILIAGRDEKIAGEFEGQARLADATRPMQKHATRNTPA